MEQMSRGALLPQKAKVARQCSTRKLSASSRGDRLRLSPSGMRFAVMKRRKQKEKLPSLANSRQVETILQRVHDKVANKPGAVSADHVLKVTCDAKRRVWL